MEQLSETNLPIVGRIQHGLQEIVNNKKRVKELGYFIAKTKNDNLTYLSNKFEEKYYKQNYLNIQFFNDSPLTIRRIRYNQSGAVCYCLKDSLKGKQKVANKWQEISCSKDCEYRLAQKGTSKPACNLEGTLKFLLPEISKDRIWIMKITSQQSIFNLSRYINFQKYLGNSIAGNYTLFLSLTEQTNHEGKKFKNYILDIVKSNDFKSQNTVNDNVITSNTSTNKVSLDKTNAVTSSASIISHTNTPDNASSINSKEEESNLKHYLLYETYSKDFIKDGVKTNYLIAKVVDINNKVFDIVIPPELRQDFEQCDTGTEIIMDLKPHGKNFIPQNITFEQKILKNEAA